MSRSLLAFTGASALLVASLASCSALLGLDDLHGRTTQADASSGNDAADAGGGCTSNVTCIEQAAGAPSMCVDGACVRLDIDEQGLEVCKDVLPSKEILRDPGVLVLATVRPPNPPKEPHLLAEQFAIEDFDHVGGIGDIGKPRRIALAVCSTPSDRVDKVVEYVTKRLRVPGMIIENADDQITRAQVERAVSENVFVVNPGKATPSLKYADLRDLLLNLLGPVEDTVVAYRPLLARVEKAVRVQRRRAGGAEFDPVRVAVVEPTYPEGALEIFRLGAEGPGSSRDPSRALTFNDAGVVANEDAGTYHPFKMPPKDPSDSQYAQYFRDNADRLRALSPDVVIVMTSPDATGSLIREYEARNTGPTAAPAPFWILGPYNAELPTPLQNSIKVAPPTSTLINRLWGIQVAGPADATEADAWRARMRDEHGPAAIGTEAAENYYDAVYWLAYGIAASGQVGKVTGPDIARGVRALWGPWSGEAVDAVKTGRNAIPKALARIRLENRRPVFVGTLGVPDIDARFSTWSSVGGVYCYGFDPSRAIRINYDVVRYDRTKNDFVDQRGGFATGSCGDGQAFLADYNIK